MFYETQSAPKHTDFPLCNKTFHNYTYHMQWLVNEDTLIGISGRLTMDAACETIGCPIPHFSLQKGACKCPLCSRYGPSMHTSADPKLRQAPQQTSQICRKLQTVTYIFPTFIYVTPQVTREFIVMLIFSQSTNTFTQMAWMRRAFTACLAYAGYVLKHGSWFKLVLSWL